VVLLPAHSDRATQCVEAADGAGLDAAGGRADRTVQLPRPDQVAVDGGRIWVTNWQRNTVSGVDAASGRVVATLKAGPPPRGGGQGVSAAIAGAGSIWVVRGADARQPAAKAAGP